MTVVILGRIESAWVAGFAAHLRRRDLTVIALESVGVVGFLLHSQRIGTLVIHEAEAPVGWERLQARCEELAPATRILRVTRDDARSLDQLADAMTP
jgi:hypothetical protein